MNELLGQLLKEAKLRQDVVLGEHQKRVKKKLDKTDALLLYHGLGSGKTLSSIAATEGDSADVVVPAALRPNYRKEVKKFTSGKDDRNIMSYEGAMKAGLKGGDALVLDEVQRLNNSGSARSQAIMAAAPNYKKRILLSGTPIKNHPHELGPILRILNPKDKRVPLDEKGFRERFIQEKKISPGIISMLRGLTPGVVESPKNLHLLADVIKGRVDYHAPASEGYPSRTDSIEHVPMSPEQTGIYNYVTSDTHPLIASKVRANLPLSKQEQASLNSFMTGARIVSNTPAPYGGKGGSPKMELAAQHLIERSKANPRFKAMAYSNYLEGGVKEYARHLDKAKVPYRIFSGEMSDAKKKQAVEDYNKDRVKALLISGAGAEGLDLKGTRLVQILEPHWNKARVEQAIGRARRFKSHDHLPEDERHVEVKHYQSVHPEKWYHKYLGVKKPTSADQYLNELAEKKEKLNQSFLDVLRQEGSKTASEKLFVYRNIAKDKTGYVYSMRSKEDGKVKGHSSDFILTGAKFKVSDAGRDRVRRESVKNVHAGVEGTLSSKKMRGPWVPVTYDPKRLSGFVRRDTGDQVHEAAAVKFTPEGVFMKSAAFWEGFEKTSGGLVTPQKLIDSAVLRRKGRDVAELFAQAKLNRDLGILNAIKKPTKLAPPQMLTPSHVDGGGDFWGGFSKRAAGPAGFLKGLRSGNKTLASAGHIASAASSAPKSGVSTAARAIAPSLPTPAKVNAAQSLMARPTGQMPGKVSVPKPHSQAGRGVSSTPI